MAPLGTRSDWSEAGTSSDTTLAMVGRGPPCAKCLQPRFPPTPIDPSNSLERAWGKGLHADTCQLCLDIIDIVAKCPEMTEKGMNDPDGREWALWQQAFVSLKVEGAVSVTAEVLSQRALLTRTILAMVTPAQLENLRSSEPPSPSDIASPAGNLMPPYTSPQKPPVGFYTPTKSAVSAATTSPGGASASSAPRAAAAAPLATTTTPRNETPMKLEEHASAHNGGGKDPDTTALRLSEGALTQGSGVPPLSVEGSLQAGATGNAIARMRKTINEYAARVSEPFWWESLKLPTMKALYRRLTHYESNINDGLCTTMIQAYQSLTARLSCMINAYTALQKWKTSDNEEHLLALLQYMQPIEAFLLTANIHGFGPDLALLLAKAKFFKASAPTAGPITAAFKEFPKTEVLKGYFNDIRDCAAAEVAAADVAEAEGDDGTGAGPKGGSKGFSRARRTTVGSDLIKEPDEVIFTAKMLDKAWQLRLHRLPAAGDAHAEGLNVIAQDLTSLLEEWRSRFPPNRVSSGIDFADLLDSLRILFMIPVPQASGGPSPSSVREARRQIQKAASAKPSFKCAEAMMHYDGCKVVMEKARGIAATGIQDESADNIFKLVCDTMESLVAVAFRSIEDWVATGNDGRAHDLASITVCMTHVQQSVVQTFMVVGQWSAARLEEKCEPLVDLFGQMLLVLDFAAPLAIKRFMMAFTILSDIFDVAVEEQEARHEVVKHEAVKIEVEKENANEEGAGVATVSEASERAGSALRGTNFIEDPMFRRSLRACSDCAAKFQHDLDKFLDKAADVLKQFEGLYLVLEDKLGAAFVEGVVESQLDLRWSMRVVDDMHGFLRKLQKYTEQTTTLMQHSPLVLADFDAPDERAEYMRTLAEFCDNHRQLGVDLALVDVDVKGEFQEMVERSRIAMFTKSFLDGPGRMIFEKHAQPTGKAATSWLESLPLKVTPLDIAVIRSNQKAEAVFDTLVQAPDSEELAKTLEGELGGGRLKDMMAGWRHNKVLSNLKSFADAIGLQTLPVVTIRRVGGERGGEQPAQQAMLFLSVACDARNLCILAAVMNERLLKPVANGKSLSKAVVAKELPEVCKNMTNVHIDLEAALASDPIKRMEGEGWEVPIPFSVLRLWRQSMAGLAGICQETLLKEWVKLIDASSAAVKGSCPAWRACEQDGLWNEGLALSLLSGQRTSIVKQYNVLHELLSMLNTAATDMQITPLLKAHPITEHSLTVAVHALQEADRTLVVVHGMDVIEAFKNSAQGPAKAAEFLRQYAGAETRNSIPERFWMLFEAMVEEKVPENRAVKVEPVGLAGAGGEATVAGALAAGVTEELMQPAGGSDSSRAGRAANVTGSGLPRRALKKRRVA